MPTATNTIDIEKLSAIYDRIYNIADRLFKKHNPCNIHIKKKRLFCKYHNEGIPLINKRYLCCSSCNYSSKNGCTVKALGCKLFLCSAVKNRILHRRLRKLRNYSHKHLSFNCHDGWGDIMNYSIVYNYNASKED